MYIESNSGFQVSIFNTLTRIDTFITKNYLTDVFKYFKGWTKISFQNLTRSEVLKKKKKIRCLILRDMTFLPYRL